MFAKLVLQLGLIISLLGSQQIYSQNKSPIYILDMVHNNPGEPLTKTIFNSSEYLKENGYNGKVMNDFTFAHAAITFKKLNPNIFPEGSEELAWVKKAADQVRLNILEAHKAGLKVYYFTDIIVLPKRLVEMYRKEICDANGKISFDRSKTIEIHKIMLEELFETFPDLDGLVIRTGETYLNNVPFHTGNNPITNGEISHLKLLNLLREEVCVKFNKKIFYRTWSFGGMHDSVSYYLNVTNQIKPHPNLVFSIKHTQGDYHRTFSFNPTLGLGNHAQIVEVQCQREYEGKGAYPNYVMDGVINGFEEYKSNAFQNGNTCLNDLKDNKNFAGVWSWSRGGGWVGPYISNEFWCKLNAFVLSHWASNTQQTEEMVFNQFMDENGIEGNSRRMFRALCLLSAKAIIRGHESNTIPFEKDWVWWMRDEFLAGIDSLAELNSFSSEGCLHDAFSKLYEKNLLKKAIDEKYESVQLWKQIVDLSKQIAMKNKRDQAYIFVSSQYGLLLHQIIAEGWNIMSMGFTGDRCGKYETKKIAASIKKYDEYWKQFKQFKITYKDAATLYKPYAFVYLAPDYHLKKGMDYSIDKYRNLISK